MLVDVDVLDVSDLRFEGGTSGSVAEEIKAQASAGYSTGLLQVNGPLLARTSPINPRIRRCIEDGLARVVLPHEPVRAKVVVVRHPAVLQHSTTELSLIETDLLVVVANAAPRDIDGFEHYNVDAVRDVALRQLGVEPTWAPIGPLVRESIEGDLGGQRAFDDDWVNIIDVDAWQAPRDRWPGDRPVIGRHSRDNPQKWPADLATLEAAYPTDGSMDVRVLGGASAVVDLYGEVPTHWDVQPFGAMSPGEFLAGLDFFVYFHNPRWVEAFGRTILEALASGAVAILPEHFSALFGNGALYTTADGVQPLIRELYADRDAYEAQVRRGQAVARERFGHEAHTARLASIIGPPAAAVETSPRTGERTTSGRGRGRSSSTRVLFISSNGSGLGHLTRLLAYAQRRRPDTSAHFLSLSQGVPIVETFGYPYEYVPSMTATGLEPSRWQDYFAVRVAEAIDRLGPSAVVFDGTVPYEGIPNVQKAHPSVPWVWSRRGMWYRGYNRDQLAKSSWLELVIEPGDFAAAADRGVTADAAATRVGPVTLLDLDDLDDRVTARQALGLDADRPAALVTLGAGNINDAASDVRVVIDRLRVLGLQICVTKPVIAERTGDVGDDVHVVRDFPLSRRYAAFDVAVSAAGYNSLQELLRFGVPTLFIPNLDTSLDDQRTRARHVAERGFACYVERAEPDPVGKFLDDLLSRGPSMAARATAVDPGNGAGAAMARVHELIDATTELA
jgi:hypothetical protein